MALDTSPVDDPYAYLAAHTENIPGWLERYAAIRTLDLLQWQETQGVRGPLLEIGVFAGRYLSLLLRSAAQTADRVIGLDTFQYLSETGVREHVAKLPGADRLTFVSGLSTDFTDGDLLEILGGRARFISIDGSHECPDVFWDLRLAEALLLPAGLVALDDFLNPLTLGVGDAAHRFFATPRNLAPFAYTANKLFLCRPAMADVCRLVFEQAILADEREPQSMSFRERATHGRHHVEQALWGHRVLIS